MHIWCTPYTFPFCIIMVPRVSFINYPNIFEEKGEDMRQEGTKKTGRRNRRRWEERRHSFMS